MAKDITLKRYSNVNGNLEWVEVNPKTTTSNLYDSAGTTQIFNSSDKLQSTYIDLATTVASSGAAASKPVTSGAVATAIQTATEDLTEIAEGKTKTFVTDLVAHTVDDVTSYYIMGQTGGDMKAVGTDIQYSTAGLTPYLVTDATDTLDFLNYLYWYCVELHSGSGNSAYYTIKWVIDCSNGDWIGANDTGGDIHIGDNLLITDTNVPDYWFTDGTGMYLSKLETTKMDLSSYQLKVPKLGSTTKPVYTSAAGTFAECSTYAGGTAVTLNGSSKAASTASFYAPTGSGTTNQVLISNGSNNAPGWATTTSTYTETGTGIFNQAGAYNLYTLVGTKADDSGVVHLAGNETITGTKTFNSTAAPQFNGGAKFKTGSNNYYVTVQANTASSNYTVTLPSTAGTLALTSELLHTYLQSSSQTPSNAHEGDVWFVTTD